MNKKTYRNFKNYSLVLVFAVIILIPFHISALQSDNGVVQQAKGTIKIGQGSANIAPPWPAKPSYGQQVPMESFYNTQIFVKALVFQVEGLTKALVVFDLIGFRGEASNYIKQKITNGTILSEDDIIIAATHNHSYPRPVDKVLDFLAEKGLEAVNEALSGMFQAKIGFSMKQMPEYLAVNRAQAAGGKICTNLYVMRIDDLEDNVRGVFFNFTPHPTYLHRWWGDDKISKHGPGWPGYVRQFVEMEHNLNTMFKMYHDGQREFNPLFTMFTMGSGGDLWVDDDFIAGIDSLGYEGWMTTVGHAVLELLNDIETTENATMLYRTKDIELPVGKAHQWRFGEPNDITSEDKSWRDPQTQLRALIINDVAFGMVPAEMSVRLGDRFREMAGYEYNIVITNVGEGKGYICSELEEIEKVTYESKSSIFDPGRGRIITDNLIKLVNPEYIASVQADPDLDMGTISGKIVYDGEQQFVVGLAGSEWHVTDYHPRFWGRRTEPDKNGYFTFERVAPWTRFLYVMEVNDDYVPYESGQFKRLLTYSNPVNVNAGDTSFVELNVSAHFKENIKAIHIKNDDIETGDDWIQGVVEIEGELQDNEQIKGCVYTREQLFGLNVRRAYALSSPVTVVEINKTGTFDFKGLEPGEYLLYFWFDVNGNDIIEPRIDLNSGFSRPIFLQSEVSFKKR